MKKTCYSYQWKNLTNGHILGKCSGGVYKRRKMLCRMWKQRTIWDRGKVRKVGEEKMVIDWSPVCKNCGTVMWKKGLKDIDKKYYAKSPIKRLCLWCYKNKKK